MIELTTPQFVALLGLSGAQLLTLIGIFNRLGRLIVGQADHESRLTKLESKNGLA
jgi:hypothetical protein